MTKVTLNCDLRHQVNFNVRPRAAADYVKIHQNIQKYVAYPESKIPLPTWGEQLYVLRPVCDIGRHQFYK